MVTGLGTEGIQARAWRSAELTWEGKLLPGVWVICTDMLERVLQGQHLLGIVSNNDNNVY